MADNSFVSATAAYRAALRNLDTAAPKTLTRDPRPVEEFSKVLRDTVQDAVAVQRHAENMSVRSIADQADLTDVVSAVANAEVTLQSVVTIRDRVISAYQDIIRMPI